MMVAQESQGRTWLFCQRYQIVVPCALCLEVSLGFCLLEVGSIGRLESNACAGREASLEMYTSVSLSSALVYSLVKPF